MVLFFCSCGLTREDLGMTRSKPDETQVETRKALVIPPEFGVRPQGGAATTDQE